MKIYDILHEQVLEQIKCYLADMDLFKFVSDENFDIKVLNRWLELNGKAAAYIQGVCHALWDKDVMLSLRSSLKDECAVKVYRGFGSDGEGLLFTVYSDRIEECRKDEECERS